MRNNILVRLCIIVGMIFCASQQALSDDSMPTLDDLKKTRTEYAQTLAGLEAIPAGKRTESQKTQIKNYKDLLKITDDAIANAGRQSDSFSNLSCGVACGKARGDLEKILKDEACMKDPQCSQCSLAFLSQSTGENGLMAQTCSGIDIAKKSKKTANWGIVAYSINATLCAINCIWPATSPLLCTGANLGAIVYETIQSAKSGDLSSLGMAAITQGQGIASGIKTAKAAKGLEAAKTAADLALEKTVSEATKAAADQAGAALKSSQASTRTNGCLGMGMALVQVGVRTASSGKATKLEKETCGQVDEFLKTTRTTTVVSASCKIQAAMMSRLLTGDDDGSPEIASDDTNPDGGPNGNGDPGSNGGGEVAKLDKDFLGQLGGKELVEGLGNIDPNSLSSDDKKQFASISQVLRKVAGDKKIAAAFRNSFPKMAAAAAAGQGVGQAAKGIEPSLSADATKALDNMAANVGTLTASHSPKSASEILAKGASIDSTSSSSGNEGKKSGEASGTDSFGEEAMEGEAVGEASGDGLAFGEERSPASEDIGGEITMDASQNIFQIISGRLNQKKKDRSILESI
jgi:hypothetical protein